MTIAKYVGMDVHKESISIAVMNSTGKFVMECVIETKGPFHDFYEHLLAQGRKPTMARLTLARKIAAITLIVWKKEVRFDASYLKSQAA
jgi:hypothetical protein